MTQEMKRVCAYCRVSTVAEKQDMSLQSQIQYYTELIDNNPNYINKGVYAEKKSGGNQNKRSQFLAMIKECRNHNIDIIYTKTISRFGRNQLELLRTLEELTELGVRVIFEIEDIDSLRDKQSIRTVIRSYFAEDDLLKNSVATKFGIQRSFEQGKVWLGSPYPLFGYKFGKNKKLIIDPTTAPIVQEVFDRYCNGERTVDIIRSLNERGIKTPAGRKWIDCSVNRMIRQERYTGTAYCQKTYRVNGKKVKNRGEKPLYVVKNFCEPIISEEQFQKAQEMRAKKRICPKEPGFIPEHDCFRGKIKCGQCGASYNKQQNGKRKYPSGKSEKITYQCHKARKTRQEECRNKHQTRQGLEDGFIKAFNTLKQSISSNTPIQYNNDELNELNYKIRQLLDKERMFLLLEIREQMTYQLKVEYNKLLKELKELQARKKEVIKYNNDVKLETYNARICEQCFNKYDKMEQFDEEIFTKMVKDIVVMNRNRVLYNFINNYTADVEIIDYYARNDKIGEVKVYVSI